MTHAKKADVKMAKSTIEQLPEFSFVVMDRGYNDYGLFEWMTLRGTHFVTRLKETAKTTLPAKKTRGKGERGATTRFSSNRTSLKKAMPPSPTVWCSGSTMSTTAGLSSSRTISN